MNFSKISNKLREFIVGAICVFMILFILGIAGFFCMISLFWLLLLPNFGLTINWYISHFFVDEYNDTDLLYKT